MGACYDEHEFDGKLSYYKLREKVEDLIKDDRIENGNSYSGTIGMASGLDIRDKVFDSYDAAYEYLRNNVEKWDDAIAVQYTQHSRKLVKPKKLAKLKADIIKTQELYEKTKRLALDNIKSKSFITCKSCKSRVNVQYIVQSCTVCSAILLSKTTIKKLGAYEAKIKELDSKKTACYKLVEGDLKWLVGALCSS